MWVSSSTARSSDRWYFLLRCSTGCRCTSPWRRHWAASASRNGQRERFLRVQGSPLKQGFKLNHSSQRQKPIQPTNFQNSLTAVFKKRVQISGVIYLPPANEFAHCFQPCVSVNLSVCPQGRTSLYNVLYSPLLTPASSPQDMFELVQLRPHYTPPASDIWWPSLETYANLFTWGPTLPPWYWH